MEIENIENINLRERFINISNNLLTEQLEKEQQVCMFYLFVLFFKYQLNVCTSFFMQFKYTLTLYYLLYNAFAYLFIYRFKNFSHSCFNLCYNKDNLYNFKQYNN